MVVFVYARIFCSFILCLLNILQYSILPISVSRTIYFALLSASLYITNTRITVHGDKQSLGKNKLLIMCNHYCGLDFVVLGNMLQNHEHPLFTIVKADIVGSTSDNNMVSNVMYYLKSALISSSYFIPYKRGDREDGALVQNTIVKTLDDGNNLLVFPEGATRKTGIPKEFKNGIFHLAIDNDLQILPITIKYKKDIGWEGAVALDLSSWFDNDVDVYIHDVVDSSKEKDFLSLKERVFNTISGPLLPPSVKG